VDTLTKRILIIDPVCTLPTALAACLGEAKYELVAAVSAAEGLADAYRVRPDLILLAVRLPDASGFQVCRSLREISNIPIILLSTAWSEDQISDGVRCGADMVLTQPISSRVMAARIKAVLRRTCPENDAAFQLERELHFRSLTVELDTRRVTFNQTPIKLSATEFRLLLCMVKNHGRVLSHDYLLKEVWGAEYTGRAEQLRLYVGYLRRKFEVDPAAPKLIRTVWGIGYRFG
jgi:two-component system KDP operon response regulator KdpE